MFKTFPLSFLFCLFFFQLSSAQDEGLLQANTIPIELRVKSNAVIRNNTIRIEVEAYNKMVYYEKRIVTILNEKGESKEGAFQSYDSNRIIKKMTALIYDANGNQIKKFKKNDFEDVSEVDGISLYSDNRRKYLDYTPISFPYTIVFETEVEYKSTAFIPKWLPIEGFYTSAQNSEYKIINNSGVDIKIKASNLEDYNIEKHSEYHYSANNILAIPFEVYSPSFLTYAPYLRAALTEFDMEGVKGVNTNWKDFGKWMNDKLISDTQELPQPVKDEISSLTSKASTDLEKAKLVYEYMQNKTRYISVQVGIGGWKPMLASDVDKLGYGDCKALTNYTKALLDEAGVTSFYTVIYGGRDLKSMDSDFSATEGNHVILCVPNNDDYIWLECTSQTNPFGYTANFTDDRDALIIMPDGGKIVHTKVYQTDDNLQETKADIALDESGNFSAKVSIETKGIQYDHHEYIENHLLKDQILYYKEYWDNINNLDILSIKLNNNKDDIVFNENVEIKAKRYASKAGNRLLLQPNLFNHASKAPPRYKNRKLPFEIDRGFIDVDEFIINLPASLEVEALKEDVSITNKFGEYAYSIKEQSDHSLIFKRTFKLNKGTYNKEDYKDFRDFWLQIVKHDKSKIALKINN